ncbi:MAG: DivIVA domain-containing protein [Gemmatimonadota bacterium]|nr:DivIVA domain-containing protein [Gemmatimonadota bacterium]
MIDLTPLDVRNKRGDFKKGLRGYETQEVDSFLEIVSERLEALVRENMVLKERLHSTQEQLNSQSGREKAVQEALVTAQELRTDIRGQAQKEAELIRNEAQADARRVIKHAQAQVLKLQEVLAELERRRSRFLKLLRQLLERELDGVEVEEGRKPLEEFAVELELGAGKAGSGAAASTRKGASKGAAGAPETAPDAETEVTTEVVEAPTGEALSLEFPEDKAGGITA